MDKEKNQESGMAGSKSRRGEGGRQAFQYEDADQLFWREVVLPNLKTLLEAYPDNKEFQQLGESILHTSYLRTKKWNVEVIAEEGEKIVLQVDDGDDQDDRQTKLVNFLDQLREKTYTPEDQKFWRNIIIPALRNLNVVYSGVPAMKLLTLTIQHRLFLKERSLNIEISGVTLDVENTDSKLEAQAKLEAFLQKLQVKSEIDINQKAYQLRIERLESEVQEQRDAARQQEEKAQKLQQELIEYQRKEEARLKADALKTKRSNVGIVNRQGSSSYRPSYSASGESGSSGSSKSKSGE